MIGGYIGLPIGGIIETSALFVTSDVVLQLPVNCVLAGEVPFKDRYREWDVPQARKTERTRVTTGGARRLSKSKSSFTTRTDSRGYD